MLTRLVLPIVTVAASLAAPATINAQSEEARMNAGVATTPVPARSGRVEINGISYHYQIHGEGEPLLLLHGGLGSTDMFAPILPLLAAGRQVIGIDLHGHGRTTLGDREFSIPAMGDDFAAILTELGYDQVDALGYSLGAGVAFRLAVQHPERVRRLAIVSAGYSRDAYFHEILEQQAQVNAAAAEFMKETPMYQSYMAIAPNPDDFPRLLDRIGILMSKDYDWAEDVKTLTMPVILVFGDSDLYRPEHMISFYKLLGGGLRDAGWMREHQSRNRLAILPGRTHYDLFFAPEMIAAVLPFLNGEQAGGSWEE